MYQQILSSPGYRQVYSGLPGPTGPSGAAAKSLTAIEDIAAGLLVNVHAATGAKIRKASNASAAKQANGFVQAAVTNGNATPVRFAGQIITGLSGLTPGATYFLGAAGAITTTPDLGASLVQEVGVALSDTELLFHPKEARGL